MGPYAREDLLAGRYAIFVDAAFLWASVGELLFGTNDRSRLTCDYDGLVGALVEATGDDARRELLRAYWYDGAVNKVPTPEQKRLGQLPSVKLRLGRIVGGHQKGVDSLIVLDLLKLATTGMVDTIYLLSGDDDLTEGVREAQALGVRVVLIGAATPLPRQSEALLLEADGVELWDEAFWRPHVSRASREAEPAHHHEPRSAPAGGEAVHTFERVGYAFSTRWLDEASDEEVERVRRSRPRIPSDIDSRLLWDTSAGRDLSEGERVALRDGFWRAVDEDAADEAADAADALDEAVDAGGAGDGREGAAGPEPAEGASA
ncbi:MAG: NYN domain-containing protein [Acidimicrobiia bacterium]|nr:NYN domain-containing protein [Acidimicrobiia bacterium]